MLAVAAAPVAAAAVGMLLALFGLAGLHPFWRETPLTLPEAVALRSGWDVVVQLRRGVDPNAPLPVRRWIVDAGRDELSAWEAAVAADRADVIQLLAREGARLTPEIARAALCLGQARDRRESVAALVRLFHVDAAQSCAPQ